MEEFIDLYRYNIYTRCKIMVNDFTDVVKEIRLFIDEKVKPYMKEKELNKLIFDGIELRREDVNFIWSIYDKNELKEPGAKEITMDNINNKFKGKKEFLKSLDEEHGIKMFPKELYGKAFMVLAETISEMASNEHLYEEINIFEIFKLGNNGVNNIIY